MAEWARVVETTMHKFVRGEEVNVLRNRMLTALLRERGRIKYGLSGDLLDWKVRYRRAPLFGFADSDTLTFSRRNRWVTAQLEWRGYATSDMMTKKESLMNKGTEAIVKVYSNLGQVLMGDMEEHFCDELYIDGEASGNSKRLHGLESCMGTGTNVAADLVGEPSDTYAGLSTALGNKGGTWSADLATAPNANVATDWPNGTGDHHYDYWSPVQVNWSSDTWAASGDTFVITGHEAIRQAIIWGQRNKSKRGMIDTFLLHSSLYKDLLTLLDSKERFISARSGTEGSLAKLGFTNVVHMDGVEVTWEYGVPTNVGYGFNVDQMELNSLQGQLFVPGGPIFDEASQAWRFWIGFWGNMKLNPRNLVKLFNYAT